MPAFTFCPRCAAPLPRNSAAPHAPQTCARCGVTHYHNAKPAAGALIVRGHQLLLAERAIDPARGAWDIPGGFLEPGEHPAEAARREALEETGLEVQVGDPPFAIAIDTYATTGDFTLNIYYLARIVGGELRAADDVASLRWFPLHDLPTRLAFAHCHEVLRRLRDAPGGAAMR